MANTIQIRRDLAANWVTANPVLAQGEIGLDLDSGQFKIGDGATAWAGLPYWTGTAPAWGAITGMLSAQTDLNGALGGKEPTIAAGTTGQYWRGDKSWQALATVATTGSAADLTGNLAIARLNGGTGATATTFWRGDGAWDAPAVSWGSITGTLSGQADLQAALDAKDPLWDFIQLTADYTLTSTTAVQQLFNATANGAYAAETGLYEVHALVWVDTMSSTAGNGALSLAGTGVLDRQVIRTFGMDATTLTNPAGVSGNWARGASGVASNSTAANAATAMAIDWYAVFRVTTAGTIIPSLALTTAAAAVIRAGSIFRIRRIADTATTTRGGWT